LLGGPLHRLGARVGLVTGQTNTVKLGLVLGILPWVVLLALALIGGLGAEFFSIRVSGTHVRLLVVIPLIFVCESVLDPRMASFVDGSLRGRCVATRSRPDLELEIARITRWKDSWLLEAVCLAVAVLVQPLAEQTGWMGVSMGIDPEHAIAAHSLAAWWWVNVCLPLVRFLLLRWLLRLALWSYFLWRVSRLELNLLPNHPDNAGGLGGLETVHRHFMPMVVAFAAVVSASFAEEVAAGTKVFAEVYPILLLMLVIVLVLFLGPVLVFAPKLQAARLQGLGALSGFAAEYVEAFDKKWLERLPPHEPLLGTPDIQSLADLVTYVRTVREMRIVPVSLQIVTTYAIGVVLPFLPLLLLKYPIAELATMLLKRLSGL
jgi:hypothetical protein